MKRIQVMLSGINTNTTGSGANAAGAIRRCFFFVFSGSSLVSVGLPEQDFSDISKSATAARNESKPLLQ